MYGNDSSDIWYLHTTLCQCFMPYKDPKTDTWERRNGEFSITLVAGHVRDPRSDTLTRRVGLPYGPKPRLFQAFVCMKSVKLKSPIIPVERSMSDMMHTLGLSVTGGKSGTINIFKQQITRYAACNFSIIGPSAKGAYSHVKTTPIRRFDVLFPTDPNQGSLWPSEIQLTTDFFESLREHAVPFDFRALKPIQAKPRAQDIYVWLTQRLCRIDNRKPLFLRWSELCDMFGGELTLKDFRKVFPRDLKAAHMSYTSAKIEEAEEGFIFRHSLPPIPKTMAVVK
jgi:Plasmid encoded RepA protein